MMRLLSLLSISRLPFALFARPHLACSLFYPIYISDGVLSNIAGDTRV